MMLMSIRILAIFALCVGMSARAEDWQLQRMPWGDPDFQGIWTNATVTTLERPEELPNLILTEQEVMEVEAGIANLKEAIDDVGEGDLQAGEDVGGYNAFWMDMGSRALRVRGEPRGSIIVTPEDGRIPYRFMDRLRFYWNGYKLLNFANNPEERPEGERCTVGFGSTGGPPMLPVLYNNNYQFAQSPGHVMILVEMNHNVRTIRLEGERLPGEIKPWLGDSTGKWEGDTLVVETTGFHPQQFLRLAIKHQVMMGSDTLVTERFTRISEEETVYQFTVSDPEIYTQDWHGEMTLRKTAGPIYEYACHEGNYALHNILAGARQEEQE